MNSLWATLIPLIIGSALVPIQILITVLLLRSAAGKRTAVAWVGGMTAIRLAQGLVFGLILTGITGSSSDSGPGQGLSVLLLVMAVLFLVTALRTWKSHPDPDDPPPAWLTMTENLSPTKAFIFGFGGLLIAPKFWIFTLGAIAAIGAADLGPGVAILTYLAFVALAEIGHLVVLGIAFAAPERADTTLARAADWLRSNDRVIVIAVSLVFGTLVLWKALEGLGVI